MRLVHFGPNREKGGGGTDMTEILTYVEEEDMACETMVILTDGYTPWPEEAPPYKLIWGITEDDIEAPVGQTIHADVQVSASAE